MRIPREIIDSVRDKVNIVEVVQRHVNLQKRGNSYVGLCPFHGEKTPSFHVVPQKNIFHCFGCQQTGDVFRFLMHMEGVDFVTSVRELAATVGIEVPERDLTPQERRALKQRASLYDVLEAAASFFESMLWTRPEGASARAYLDERAMKRETLTEARVGFAPDQWSALVDHLRAQGFDSRLAYDAGLAKERRQGDGYYDTFRNRIVFPIRDARGRTIGFGGRLIDGDGPKYLNSPETRLYEKSQVLYGLYEGRRAIQQRERVIVVEGYFDVLALQQAGFNEAVATCGTALTQEHLERLRRQARDVILLLDSDEAGSRAAERALPMLLDAEMVPWRLMLPDAKDPDELIRQHGPEAMEQALTRKQPLLEWFVRRRRDQAGNDSVSVDRLVTELLPILARVRGSAISRVAGLLGVNEASLQREVSQAARQVGRGDRVPESPRPRGTWAPRRDIVHLLWLLVHRYPLTADILASFPMTLLQDEPEVVQDMLSRLANGEPPASVLADLTDDTARRTLSAVVARQTLYDEEEAALAMCQLIDTLDRAQKSARERALIQQMQDASQKKNREAMVAAVAELQSLKSLLKRLEGALLARKIPEWLAIHAASRDGS